MKHDWIAQGQDMCCFVYSAANILVYEGRPVPDLEPIKDIGCCRNGATIHRHKVLNALGLSLRETNRAEEVFANGGILIILHPIWNLHAIFVTPKENEHVIAINSFLGPVECRLDTATLSRFLPPPLHARHFMRSRAP